MNSLIKTKHRVRDHGEVFTPDFIVNDMLDLVKNESERIESRFLEPACGNGNFLTVVLERKLRVIEKKYKRSHHDFEKYTTIAVGTIYGIDLLIDNVHEAQERLYKLVEEKYTRLFKKYLNKKFLWSIKYILEKNILQGNALSLQTVTWKPIVFAERSLITWWKIKRRDFIFEELIRDEQWWQQGSTDLKSDTWKPVFIPEPIKDYEPIYFLDIHTQNDDTSIQSWCVRRLSKSKQWWGLHTTKISEPNVGLFAKWDLVQ